jgi:hypothetical protein
MKPLRFGICTLGSVWALMTAVVFFSGGHIVKVSIIREQRHELRRVFRLGFRQRIQSADDLFVAGFFGCLCVQSSTF